MLAPASRATALPDKAGTGEEQESNGRLNGDNPFGGILFTERNSAVVDAVRGVADEVGRSMAEVALAWLLQRPGVSCILIGASRVEQLRQNVASLGLVLSDDQRRRLDEVSALPMLSPYFIFNLPLQAIFGGQTVRSWSDRRPA